MREVDFVPFCGLLCDTLGMWGETPSATLQAMWFRALSQHPFPVIEQAFSAHLRDPQNGKFAPKPAHIVAQIEQAVANDGRPEANEAWATAITSLDENDTVVWTGETAEAFGVARSILDLGDKVGARMAFIDAYQRLVIAARSMRHPVQWQVSEGFDKERRRLAISTAIELGRIPARDYSALTAPEVNLLLTGPQAVGGGMPDSVREKLAQLRGQFAGVSRSPSAADIARANTAKAKADAAAKVAAYIAKQQGGAP